jgi:hypothetical protein
MKRMSKPCKECPFKKDSVKGWLGAASGNPQEFLSSMEYNLLGCHMKVNWEEATDEEIEARAVKHPCIGALSFCENSAKFPRGARVEGPYREHLDRAEKNPDVFKWSYEFIQHHTLP